MKSTISQYIILAFMLSASVLAGMLHPTLHFVNEAKRMDLEKIIPSQFGEWRQDVHRTFHIINPQQKSTMEKLYKQTLSRIYINAAEERIMLSIAYGDNQSDILEMHFPEACYPSQGYEVTDGKNAVIKTDFGNLRVRNLMTILGDRTEPLTYWVMVGNRNVINRNEAKLARLSYGLHGQIADGLIFRVSTITTDAEAGYDKQRSFINSLLNSMNAKDRVRLTGLTGLKENKLTNKDINLKTLLCREQRFGSARCNFLQFDYFFA